MTNTSRLTLIALLLTALVAPAARAGYNVEVNTAPGFDEVAAVVIVTLDCGEGVNCRKVEDAAAALLRRLAPEWRVAGGPPVRSALLAAGAESYTTDMRAGFAETMKVDSLLELEIPYGKTGEVAVRGAEVKVKVRMVRPGGTILLVGDGVGRPMNTLTSPESAANEIVERIFEKVLKGAKRR